jgi:hypothetical protein
LAQDNDILQELRQQTRWLRLLGYQALKPMLRDALKNDKQRLVYEYSDGNRTSREIAGMAGVGAGTVSKLWTTWQAEGICIESPLRPGRAQHLAPLSRLGIELPASSEKGSSPPDGTAEKDGAGQGDDE